MSGFLAMTDDDETLRAAFEQGFRGWPMYTGTAEQAKAYDTGKAMASVALMKALAQWAKK